MERGDKEIRDQMQSHFSDFEFEVPGNDLWPDIEGKIGNNRKRKFLWYALAGAIAFFIIGFLSGLGYYKMSTDQLQSSNEISFNEKTENTQNSTQIASPKSETDANSLNQHANNSNTNSESYASDGIENAVSQSPNIQNGSESNYENDRQTNSNNNNNTPASEMPSSNSPSVQNKNKQEDNYLVTNVNAIEKSFNQHKGNEHRADEPLTQYINEKGNDNKDVNSENNEAKNHPEGAYPQSNKDKVSSDHSNSIATNTTPELDNNLKSNNKDLPENENNLIANHIPEALPEDSSDAKEGKDNQNSTSLVEDSKEKNKPKKEKKEFAHGLQLIAHAGIGNSHRILSSAGNFPSPGLISLSKADALPATTLGINAIPTDFTSLDYSIPVNLNILIQKQISSRWSLETGLMLTKLNSEFSNGLNIYRPRLTYLTLPLGASYQFLQKQNTTLEFNIQSRTGMILTSKMRSIADPYYENYSNYYDSYNDNSGIIQANASLGHDIIPSKTGINSSIALGLGINQRLSDKWNLNGRAGVSTFLVHDNQEAYVRTIQNFWPELHLGVGFKLK